MKRSTSRRTTQVKIAFIVEGDTEKHLVEGLARKVVERLHPSATPCFKTVRLGGPPHIQGLLTVVLILRASGYERFIVVFGTEGTGSREMSSVLGQIRAPLVRGGMAEGVVLIPVAPSLERWVLADEESVERAARKHIPREQPRRRRHPKQLLEELLGGWTEKEQRKVAKLIDPERLRARDGSFDLFFRALQEALEARPRQTPAEPDLTSP
jgi:hypothetical protein